MTLCRVAIVTYSGEIIFFFQAEDGIRDLTVTGVQTCALPILLLLVIIFAFMNAPLIRFSPRARMPESVRPGRARSIRWLNPYTQSEVASVEIGRASCRERV